MRKLSSNIIVAILFVVVSFTSCTNIKSRNLNNDAGTVFVDIEGRNMMEYFSDFDIPKDVNDYINQNKVSIDDIKEQLAKQKDLKLFEGVLGGTPYIVMESVRLVKEQWVYCVAEDGHIQSGILLKFVIEKDEKAIQFKVCANDVNEEGTKILSDE